MDVQPMPRAAPGPSNLERLPTQQFDDETSSISSLQESSPISPILPPPPSFFPASAHKPETVAPSRWPPQLLNGGSSHGQSEERVATVMYTYSYSITLDTNALRRSVSERGPRRDSGISFNDPNGLYYAKMSAESIDRAMRNDWQRPSPRPLQGGPQLLAPERLNAGLSINAAGQQSNSVRAGLRTNHTLNSLPSTSGLNRNEAKWMPCFSSLRRTNRNIDPRAVRFKNIERESDLTQKRILEEHLEKTLNIVPPPLSEEPKRDVEFGVKTGRSVDNGQAGRFGDVVAEDDMEEELKEKGLWRKMAKRLKGWGKHRTRKEG